MLNDDSNWSEGKRQVGIIEHVLKEPIRALIWQKHVLLQLGIHNLTLQPDLFLPSRVNGMAARY